VATETELLALARGLGEITAPGVGMAAGMHDGKVYSVHVRSGGGEVDRHGKVILSTTDLEFPLHTDAYNLPEPPRYVFLLRTDHGRDETLSYVSDSAEALDDLGDDEVATLAQPLFPSARGAVALLEPVSGGRRRLRYNGEEIARWTSPDAPLDTAGRQAQEALAESLRSRSQSFVIEPADCLLLDNWRLCHGRGSLSKDSIRTLKRVWVA
jgi:alpha-ketoglutarate-dependent taurine dioxygenase